MTLGFGLRTWRNRTSGGWRPSSIRNGDGLALAAREGEVTIQVEGGPAYSAEGDITNHEYEVQNDGVLIAQISRQWFSLRDAYGVAVAPDLDQALILSAAACIDEISERERERNR
jgi:uncharacterized protein YxjI